MIPRLLASVALALCLVQTALAIPGANQVKATLLGASDGIAPGESVTVGIQLDIADHWHTYWINPGDSGKATTVSWELPEGFTAGPVQFPAPSTFTTAGMIGYGYEGKVIHLVEITAPASASIGSEVTLSGQAKWLVCDPSRCMPGQASLELVLPIKAASDIQPTADTELLAGASAPTSPPRASLTFEATETEITFSIVGAPDLGAAPKIFVESSDLVAHDKAPVISKQGDLTTITLPKHEYFSEVPEEVGLVVVPESGTAVQFSNAPVIAPIPAAVATPATSKSAASTITDDLDAQKAAIAEIRSWGISGGEKEAKNLFVILLGSLIGGIILNLMPCVFPVLGIKIMGFVQQAGEDKAKIKKHGLVFGLGVLCSLWALAAVILVIRFGGDSVGWGFQLQNPLFILIMVVVILAFGLNLAGLFEFGTSLIGAGQDLQQKEGYAGSFFSGVLAVAIATPCTGPFMASALTYALSAPVFASLLVFTALGVGLALPYVMLSFFPALIEKLPRPGAWMETFKQFMAFPMIATAIWLALVYGQNMGFTALRWLLYGLVIFGLGLWVYGRFDVPSRTNKIRNLARIAAIALMVLFAALTWKGYSAAMAERNLTAKNNSKSAEKTKVKYGLEWEPIDAVAIVQHRAKGRTVFLDFTADW